MVQSSLFSFPISKNSKVSAVANREKYYKIGEVAKAFSLSKNTLRYYEHRGVLSPVYEDSNGYRYYDNEQIHMIGSLKKLQNMGLSVDQSKTVFSGISLEGVGELVSDCLERELQQAKLHSYLAETLQKILFRLQNTSAYGQITRTEMAEHYEIRLGDIRSMMDDGELHQYAPQWLDHAFPVMNLHRLAVEDVEAGRYAPDFALSVDSTGAQLLELDVTNPFVTFHPAQDCLHVCNCFTSSRQDASLTFHYLEQCQAMLQRCREEGMIPLNTFYCNGLFTFLDQDGKSNKIGDIYLPVTTAQA